MCRAKAKQKPLNTLNNTVLYNISDWIKDLCHNRELYQVIIFKKLEFTSSELKTYSILELRTCLPCVLKDNPCCRRWCKLWCDKCLNMVGIGAFFTFQANVRRTYVGAAWCTVGQVSTASCCDLT